MTELDAKMLARAILRAAKEDGRRSVDEGFDWYGSASEMAAAILAAISAEEEADPEWSHLAELDVAPFADLTGTETGTDERARMDGSGSK